MSTLDLSDGAIAAWLGKLPEDVRQAVSAGEPATGKAEKLQKALSSVTVWQVPDLVREHADDAIAFGRARRMRLMAWMASSASQNPEVFRKLVGEHEDGDDKEGGKSGSDVVGILFLEDIKALAKYVVTPRLSQRMIAPEVLDSAVEAAYVLENENVFRTGGMG